MTWAVLSVQTRPSLRAWFMRSLSKESGVPPDHSPAGCRLGYTGNADDTPDGDSVGRMPKCPSSWGAFWVSLAVATLGTTKRIRIGGCTCRSADGCDEADKIRRHPRFPNTSPSEGGPPIVWAPRIPSGITPRGGDLGISRRNNPPQPCLGAGNACKFFMDTFYVRGADFFIKRIKKPASIHVVFEPKKTKTKHEKNQHQSMLYST